MGTDQNNDTQDATPTPAPSDESPSRRHKARIPAGFSTIRDLITFVIGVGIVINEVFIQPTVEPTSITIGIAMAGLPVVFGADERKRG